MGGELSLSFGGVSDIKMIFDLASNIVFVKDIFIFISKFEGAAKRYVISGSGLKSRGLTFWVLRFGSVFSGCWALWSYEINIFSRDVCILF